MERVHSINWEIFTEGISRMIILMADYVMKGKMVIPMMGNGGKVKNTDMESTIGLMEANMRVIMSMVKNTVKVE